MTLNACWVFCGFFLKNLFGKCQSFNREGTLCYLLAAGREFHRIGPPIVNAQLLVGMNVQNVININIQFQVYFVKRYMIPHILDTFLWKWPILLMWWSNPLAVTKFPSKFTVVHHATMNLEARPGEINESLIKMWKGFATDFTAFPFMKHPKALWLTQMMFGYFN